MKDQSRRFSLPGNLLYTLVFITAAASINATYEEILNDKNKQIEVINIQIEGAKNTVQRYGDALKTLQKEIDSLKDLHAALSDFLKNYQEQKYLTPGEITKETSTVALLERDVERIQNSFKNKIINLYKRGKNYELELLLSSKTPNEFIRRNQYLQKFAQNRKKELRELKSKKFLIEEKKMLLNLSTSSQRIYVESKRNENQKIEGTLQSRNKKKSELEYGIKLNEEKITHEESELINVRNFIKNFIRTRQTFKGSKDSRINYSSDNLEQTKGNLNPPVDLGLIKNDFGNITDSRTLSTFFNNGVDFSIAYGSKVYSVAGGKVTLIGQIPFYGKAVIITHPNGFRTLYASLSEINVKPRETVRLNQVIGKSGENMDGQCLHFELWKDKTPLNPGEWLRF